MNFISRWFFGKGNWMNELRDKGYKDSFDAGSLAYAISAYDPDKMGVSVAQIAGGYAAKTHSENEEFGGWVGEGKSEEEALGVLLLEFIKKYGVLDWEGLFK
jgi:hypothetical protein